jgi:hypothetical protein
VVDVDSSFGLPYLDCRPVDVSAADPVMDVEFHHGHGPYAVWPTGWFEDPRHVATVDCVGLIELGQVNDPTGDIDRGDDGCTAVPVSLEEEQLQQQQRGVPGSARPPPGTEIHIRDSKSPDGEILIFPIVAWSSFLVAVKECVFVRARGPERISAASERENRA